MGNGADGGDGMAAGADIYMEGFTRLFYTVSSGQEVSLNVDSDALRTSGSRGDSILAKEGDGQLSLTGGGAVNILTVRLGTLEIADETFSIRSLQVTDSSVHPGATLLVNGTLNGVITLDSGSIIAGSGTLMNESAYSLDASFATLRPGNSAGTLTFDRLRLGEHSVLDFELGADSLNSDKLIVTDDLLLDGLLNITLLEDFQQGTFEIIEYNFSFADNGLMLNSVPEGYDAWLTHDSQSGKVLLTVVPEPATASLLLGAGILAWLRRRR